MSKKMTPCEKLGYKVGDKFTVIKDSYFEKGTIVALSEDDWSEAPWFTCGGVRRALIIGSNPDVEPAPSKLKPAKQALADAIHQNGGWLVAGDYNFVTPNRSGVVKFFYQNPLRNGDNWVGGPCSLSWIDLHQQLPNWHQCILSRGEYFIAYPEQVNVEVNNETKHQVEVEMKSESEMTINASDWHKNGELPPVGEVCLYVVSDRCSAEVEITAHAKLGLCFVEIGKSGECYVSKTAELHRFRPIRTEREKAIDEMVDVICDNGFLSKDGTESKRIANRLLDAGYRKEVK